MTGLVADKTKLITNKYIVDKLKVEEEIKIKEKDILNGISD